MNRSQPNPRSHRVVVVGGGIGGLSAAAHLAASGARVTLLERGPRVGGKMRQVELAGRFLDVGPTVLTMRWVFDRLFSELGERLEDHVSLRRAEVVARHFWADGSRLDLYDDIDRSAAAIAEFAGSGDAEGFRRFAEYARRIYDACETPFILSDQPGLLGMLRATNLRHLPGLTRIDFGRTMWEALARFFSDPRLRQLFARYATYYGSSPFEAPATLNLIAHVEMDGVWLIEGGMQHLADALRGLAERHGAEVRTGAHVERLLVEGERARGVILRGGEQIVADAVVFNGDTGALASGLLGADAIAAARAPEVADRSFSALTLATVAPTRGLPLVRHNVFFSDDYVAEFDDIVGSRSLPRQPTVYVCAQDRWHDGEVVDGAERLFFIINAPARGDLTDIPSAEVESCISHAFEQLHRCGLTVQRTSDTRTTTPSDFERLFPGSGGALYGQATHGWSAALERQGARSRIPGLFLAGGTVHPGAGVPMTALSGRLAANSIIEDLASIPPSRPTATPGGTSTQSATMAV